MSAAKHTPGPWTVESNDTRYIVGGGYWIAQMHGGNSEANARLIAAAPDMAKALRLAFKILDETGSLTYRRRVLEDLGADVCNECGESVVEADRYEIEHKSDCEVGRLLALRRAIDLTEE